MPPAGSPAKPGLDPRTEIQVAMAGPPPAIQAALEAGRIDAYILSPPEGLLSEDARTGQVLIRMGDEFKQLKNIPFLVLAIKTPVDPAPSRPHPPIPQALQSACTQLLANPPIVAAKIQETLYPRIKAPVMQAAILGLKSGIETRVASKKPASTPSSTYAGDAATGSTPHNTTSDQQILGRSRRMIGPIPADATIPETPRPLPR